MLRGTLKALGALTLLGGCDVSENAQLQTVLRTVSDWNDRAQAFIFRPDHLAPTYAEAQVVKPPRFNAHYDIEEVKPVDGATWKLELSGLVDDKRPWTVEELYQLPEQEIIIKHICVEGWDYIGQWSGVNLRAFFERIGADTTAKYVAFRCADDYTESLDMASALHPQTMLATKYAEGADRRSLWLPAAAADGDKARLQERQMGDRDRSHQRFSRYVLPQGRVQSTGSAGIMRAPSFH